MTSDSEKLVKVCPKCGSTNISSGYNVMNSAIKDYCGDCGFNKVESILPIFPTMTKSEAEKLQKKLKKK